MKFTGISNTKFPTENSKMNELFYDCDYETHLNMSIVRIVTTNPTMESMEPMIVRTSNVVFTASEFAGGFTLCIC